MLWLNTSGRTANSTSSDASEPRTSDTSVSTRVPGRRRADRRDARGDVGHPSVGQVVTGDHRQHGVLEAHAVDGLGHPLRLVGRRRLRVPRVDEAEPAGAGAPLPQHHERRRAVAPTLGQVRAAGVLAHGDEPEVADRALQLQHLRTVVHLRPQPLRLARLDRQPRRDTGTGEAGAQPGLQRAPGRLARRLARTATGRPGGASMRRPVDRRSRCPTARLASRAITSTTSRIVASTPSSASDVTGRSGIPQATMCWRRYVMSVVTLRAKPCIVRPPLSRTPMAQILRGDGPSASTHTPGYSVIRPACTPNVASASITSCSTLRTCWAAPSRCAVVTIGYPTSCPGPW